MTFDQFVAKWLERKAEPLPQRKPGTIFEDTDYQVRVTAYATRAEAELAEMERDRQPITSWGQVPVGVRVFVRLLDVRGVYVRQEDGIGPWGLPHLGRGILDAQAWAEDP